MSKNDPAFPNPEHQVGLYSHLNGLSKREYFAAKAMQALLTTDRYAKHLNDIEDERFPQRIAALAAEFSDALLAELEKKGSE